MPRCPGVSDGAEDTEPTQPQGCAQPLEPSVLGQQHPGVLCRVRRGLPKDQLCLVQPLIEGRAMPLLHVLLQDLASLPLWLALCQIFFLSRASCTSLCSREFLITAVGCLLSPENMNLVNNSV